LPVVQSATMGSTPGPPFPLVESKLRPPPARPGIVPRTALVDRLLGSYATPISCVVAPPGYGKTTLLAQWAERKGRWVGWVSVDHRDNDPAVLLTYIATALDRVELIDPGCSMLWPRPASPSRPRSCPGWRPRCPP
jgi:LuxR family maltose regulon positive regulatory protein